MVVAAPMQADHGDRSDAADVAVSGARPHVGTNAVACGLRAAGDEDGMASAESNAASTVEPCTRSTRAELQMAEPVGADTPGAEASRAELPSAGRRCRRRGRRCRRRGCRGGSVRPSIAWPPSAGPTVGSRMVEPPTSIEGGATNEGRAGVRTVELEACADGGDCSDGCADVGRMTNPMPVSASSVSCVTRILASERATARPSVSGAAADGTRALVSSARPLRAEPPMIGEPNRRRHLAAISGVAGDMRTLPCAAAVISAAEVRRGDATAEGRLHASSQYAP